MDISSVGQKIKSKINQANNILLVAHQQPDADALGSLMAFSEWLASLNKSHVRFCLDQPRTNLLWLLKFEPLVTDHNFLASRDFDLAIILDSGDLAYAGAADLLASLPRKPFIINIDHHSTNQHFGDINLVDSNAVSTTEIIYQLFDFLQLNISANLANALLAGIIYDTYNFTNPNTTHQSLEISSKLLLHGAQLRQVSDSILKTKSVDILKVWGKILVRLNYNKEFDIATTVITKEDTLGNLTESEVTEGVANFLNNLTGVKAAMILQELGSGFIKGSLRTNNDLIDVSKLARILGGGGHKKAAGFKIKGKLAKTEGSWKIV